MLKRLVSKLLIENALENNISSGEVKRFSVSKGLPSLELGDGTILSSYWSDSTIPELHVRSLRVPLGFERLILDYVLRFKYPHALPDRTIRTGLLPRRSYPRVLHLQHKNTLWDLPPADVKPFVEAFKIRAGDVVVEIGSYIGFGTVRLGRMVGAEGHVLSVEAEKSAHDLKTWNLGANEIENVSCFNAAVAESDGDIELVGAGYQMNAVSGAGVQDGQKRVVEAMSLSRVLERAPRAPRLIILTINGGEYLALRGSEESLSRLKSTNIIVAGWNRDAEGVISRRVATLLDKNGFRVGMTSGGAVYAFKG